MLDDVFRKMAEKAIDPFIKGRLLDLATRYEDGDHTIRSLQKHQAWLAALPCPVLRLDGARPLPELVQDVLAAITPAG